jgi:thiopeptide-type bacteriocin biosynthesis protein
MSQTRPAVAARTDALNADCFVLRTPLLAFDEFLRLCESGELDVTRERLRAAVARPEVREAILVASPDLEASLSAWLSDPQGEPAKGTAEACLRYFARMCGRPTPFGLFAGCSLGRVGGAETQLELAGRRAARRHTRLDMGLLAGLVDVLGRDPKVRECLVFRPNSSLYRAAGRMHYVEAVLRDGTRRHRLVALDPDASLDLVLGRAQAGAKLAELARGLLEAEPDLAHDDVAAYLGELVDAQVLVSDLEPALTGAEPLRVLVCRLGSIPDAGPVRDLLEHAIRALEKLDAGGVGADPELYRSLARDLGALPVHVEPNRMLQVDLIQSSPRAALGGAVLDELVLGARLLQRIALPPPDPLAAFRDAFVARYEAREVPLVEVLDEESGIGFELSGHPAADPSPLLDGLRLEPGGRAGGAGDRRVHDGRERALLAILDRAIRSGAHEVTLTSGDIDRLEKAARERGAPPPLPDAIAVCATLAARSSEELRHGNFRVLFEHVQGPSGATLLGRFCHGDEELRQAVERHLRAEEALQPDAIFVEVAHLPEGRLGNVLLRPALRRHEIPYLAASGAAPEDRIPVEDLLVSVVGDEVRLHSARLGKRVLPRLTSAHNFWGSVGVYRFLCALQAQVGVSWSWGALEGAPFLPRVSAGRLVLARARWLVEGDVLKTLRRLAVEERSQSLARLRAELRLPRFVLLADGDNELPADLDNPLSVASLLGAARGDGPHVLLEMFPAPEELPAFGPEGRFVHQLVVPFVRMAREPDARAVRTGAGRPAAARASSATRSFPPGSEWLYLKLYGGTGGADRVLLDLVAPRVAEARRSGLADRWYFLRYADPGTHLRVRLRGDPARLLAEFLPSLHEAARPWLGDGRLHRLQLDTYEREVERYGGPEGIEIAEAIFEADSDMVVAVLPHVIGDAALDARWRLALVGVDRLLDDLGLDEPARLRVLGAMREAYAREHGLDTQSERLGERLRTERKALEALRAGDVAADSPMALALPHVAERSERLKPLVAALRGHAAAGRLDASLEDLAASFVHMQVNRLIRSAPRAHEAVLYHFLWQLDRARHARALTPDMRALAHQEGDRDAR